MARRNSSLGATPYSMRRSAPPWHPTSISMTSLGTFARAIAASNCSRSQRNGTKPNSMRLFCPSTPLQTMPRTWPAASSFTARYHALSWATLGSSSVDPGQAVPVCGCVASKALLDRGLGTGDPTGGVSVVHPRVARTQSVNTTALSGSTQHERARETERVHSPVGGDTRRFAWCNSDGLIDAGSALHEDCRQSRSRLPKFERRAFRRRRPAVRRVCQQRPSSIGPCQLL